MTPEERSALRAQVQESSRYATFDSLDIEALLDEVERLSKMLLTLGFCPKDGDSMPCMTCGAGL